MLTGVRCGDAGRRRRFDEVREFAGTRHRIVASSHELQERKLIKSVSLAAAMARTLRARGLGDTATALAARTGTTVMHIAFKQRVDDPSRTPFQQIARDALARLREIASAG